MKCWSPCPNTKPTSNNSLKSHFPEFSAPETSSGAKFKLSSNRQSANLCKKSVMKARKSKNTSAKQKRGFLLPGAEIREKGERVKRKLFGDIKVRFTRQKRKLQSWRWMHFCRIFLTGCPKNNKRRSYCKFAVHWLVLTERCLNMHFVSTLTLELSDSSGLPRPLTGKMIHKVIKRCAQGNDSE